MFDLFMNYTKPMNYGGRALKIETIFLIFHGFVEFLIKTDVPFILRNNVNLLPIVKC